MVEKCVDLLVEFGHPHCTNGRPLPSRNIRHIHSYALVVRLIYVQTYATMKSIVWCVLCKFLKRVCSVSNRLNKKTYICSFFCLCLALAVCSTFLFWFFCVVLFFFSRLINCCRLRFCLFVFV